MARLQVECPSTFLILPGEKRPLDIQNLFSTPYTLYLLCQHPSSPHIVKDEPGYPVKQPRGWWRELAPWLQQLNTYLRYIPKARALAEAYDEDIFDKIQVSMDIFENILENIPEDISASDPLKPLSPSSNRFADTKVTGAALRALEYFLQQVDSKHRWCNLECVPTSEGSILWLCPEHKKQHTI
jgi:hypothetical protein